MHRFQKFALWMGCVIAGGGILTACSTLPKVKHSRYKFPDQDQAFMGDATRPYVTLGIVRAKVNFQTLDPFNEDVDYCKNYYNKAVNDLVKFAHDKGGDAVIDVKSVVFFEDGSSKLYPTPECSDDGEEGQILTQGIAIRWKKDIEKSDEEKSDEKNEIDDLGAHEAKGVKAPKNLKDPKNASRVKKDLGVDTTPEIKNFKQSN